MFGAGYIIMLGVVLPEVAGYENITAANGLLFYKPILIFVWYIYYICYHYTL